MASPSTQRTPKRPLPDQPRVVTLSLTGPGDKVLKAKIKGDVPLRKLLRKYFDEVSVDPLTVEALYDGHRLAPDSTANELGMDDVDEIQVVTRSDGGDSCKRVRF